MKKRVLLTTPFLALLATFVGCTSILGNFDVSNAVGGDGGGEGGACTQCGADCVDLTSSAAHCGKCEVACTSGQTCQASECKCPADQAFCDSKCVKADRAHCGSACSACQSDEICSSACVAAPLPEFASKPRETTGWVDENDKPLTFTLKPTGSPGTIYECRTGPDADFSPTTPGWAPCDGAAGTGTTHTPTPDAMKPEGTYRTEYRYRSDTYRSPTAFYVYYTHHSLDRAPLCPRAGHPEDGPHFTDDQYFAAAQAYGVANQANFPTVATFPAPSNPPLTTDPIHLQRPFIKIPFTDIHVTVHMRMSDGFTNTAGQQTAPPWPPDHGDYLFNERTLRHKYVMNPSRTMILLRREYARPRTISSPIQDCSNTIHTGDKQSKDFYGPADANRGKHKFDCDAIVVNTHGNGLCVGKNAAGTAPELIAIDQDPLAASLVTGGTVTVDAAGSATTTGSFGGLLNYYIEIPQSFGQWFKITTLIDNTHAKITPAPGAALAPTVYRVSPKLTPVFNIPTGYVKLHEHAHGSATGVKPPGTPSPRTKCETPGCNAGKPWLIFLPP